MFSHEYIDRRREEEFKLSEAKYKKGGVDRILTEVGLT
jgi:hypothetical protein